MRYSYSLVISTFCNLIARGKFQGKGRTLEADQVSSSTLPCCKRLVKRRINHAHSDLDRLHQVLHALSEAGAKHSQTVLSEYILRRFRLVQVGRGVFRLCKGEKEQELVM